MSDRTDLARRCRQAVAAIERRRDRWAAQHGLRESQGRRCPRRLVGRRCATQTRWSGGGSPPTCACLADWADHVSLWLDASGRPALWLAQPYGLLDEALREIVALCDELGLEAQIDARSWWYPGSTVAVLLRRRRGDTEE